MTDVDKLIARLRNSLNTGGFTEADFDGKLDELVHDEFSRRASAMNNSGWEGQVEFLCQVLSVEAVETEIDKL